MTYYIFIKNEKLNGAGECRQLTDGVINLEVSEELYNAYIENPDMYIWDGVRVAIDSEYEAKQAQKEKERIAKLSCTKRDFALMLQEMGVDYFTTLKPLIESNPQAQLEWELCERLYRFNPMLDLMASQMGVTSEQLDGLFKYANREITLEEFRALKPVEEPTDPQENQDTSEVEPTDDPSLTHEDEKETEVEDEIS